MFGPHRKLENIETSVGLEEMEPYLIRRFGHIQTTGLQHRWCDLKQIQIPLFGGKLPQIGARKVMRILNGNTL